MIKGIWAGMIYYNDGPEMLEKAMKAVLAANMRLVAVDGAYKEFPHTNHHSTDGCREVAEKYATIHIPTLPDRPWENQAEKRNQYFQAIPVEDYCFVLDADEVLRPVDFKKINLHRDIYRVILNRTTGKHLSFSTVRIYKVYKDLRYLYQHCRLYRTNEHFPEKDMESGCVVSAHSPENANLPVAVDEHDERIAFDHLCHLRPEGRIKDKDVYYQKREEAMMGYTR